MEQLIIELEQLLAERRKIKNIINSPQGLAIHTDGGVLMLDSDNAQFTPQLNRFKSSVSGDMNSYLSFINKSIKSKITEIQAA